MVARARPGEATSRSAGGGRSRASRALAIALVASVGLLGAVVGFAPLRSYDYWWQLRTGQLIAATGSVPRFDPFTYSVPGARWVDLHWVFQLGLYGLYELGGHQAVRLAKGGCVLLLLAILGSIGWRRSRPAVTALALGAAAFGAADRLFERPELLSFVLLAAQLAVLARHRHRGGRWVYAVLPLQLLWANLHGLFALGIAVCALALLAEAIRPRLRPGAVLRRDRVRDLAAVTALAVLVSFVNPNGAAAVWLPLEQLGMIGPTGVRSDLGATISELRPTLAVAGGAARLAVAAGPVLAAMFLNRRRLEPFDLLLIGAFGMLALAAERNVALLAVAAAPVAVGNFNDWLDRHPLPRWAGPTGATAVLALLLGASAFQLRAQGDPWAAGPLEEGRFPAAAVDWIARERPPGPVFHAMGDGGYLIWRLYPDYPVMVDGRLEVFGAERYAQLRVTTSGRPAGFRRLDERYHFGVALLHHRFFRGLRLLRWMARDPGWRLVYLDEVAAVFVRVGSAPPGWPEVGAGGSELLPPLAPSERGPSDLRRRAARFSLLAALGRPDEAASLAAATCARYAGRPAAPFRCAPAAAAAPGGSPPEPGG